MNAHIILLPPRDINIKSEIKISTRFFHFNFALDIDLYQVEQY